MGSAPRLVFGVVHYGSTKMGTFRFRIFVSAHLALPDNAVVVWRAAISQEEAEAWAGELLAQCKEQRKLLANKPFPKELFQRKRPQITQPPKKPVAPTGPLPIQAGEVVRHFDGQGVHYGFMIEQREKYSLIAMLTSHTGWAPSARPATATELLFLHPRHEARFGSLAATSVLNIHLHPCGRALVEAEAVTLREEFRRLERQATLDRVRPSTGATSA